MKENLLLPVFIVSGTLSLTHVVFTFLLVPHIFGGLTSISLLIFNILAIVYVVKVRKQIQEDFKSQYEKMGKKKDNSKLTKCVFFSVAAFYIIINILMISMLITRMITVFIDRTNIDVTEFPLECSQERMNGCSRLVLD